MKRRAAGAGVGAWACTALEPVGDTCTLRKNAIWPHSELSANAHLTSRDRRQTDSTAL